MFRMIAGTPPIKRFEPAEIESHIALKLVQPLPGAAYDLLARYLELLYRWNQRMNLTAVRDPQVLIELHLAECLRAAQRIPAGVESVLDFGSGAGLPGIPLQIARPDLHVTLAESQKKKASFLREAVRELGLTHADVHPGRVEDLPTGQTFDLVTLRAVDKMAEALETAVPRIRPPQASRKGWCLVLTSLPEAEKIRTLQKIPAGQSAAQPAAIDWLLPEAIPVTDQRVLLLGYRSR